MYSFIKEDVNATTQEATPRKYFSGGLGAVPVADLETTNKLPVGTGAGIRSNGKDWDIAVNFVSPDNDLAQAPFVQLNSSDDAMSEQSKASNFFVGSEAVRISEINGLLNEIEKEKKTPGAGDLPEIVVISDYHGEVGLFLKYIADAISQRIGKSTQLVPDVSVKKQLEKQGVDLNNLKFKFYLLGDFLDRGPYGVKAFRVAEELINLGLAEYVTGNHDLWAFLNLMGYHLPVYEGYNFYGNVAAADLVKSHWNDSDIAENRIGWWINWQSITLIKRSFRQQYLTEMSKVLECH